MKELAARLRGDAVDVRLDQWHSVPGAQLPHFMEREILGNDYGRGGEINLSCKHSLTKMMCF